MLQSGFRFRDLRDIFLSLNDDSGEFFISEPGDHLFNEQRLSILNRSGEIMKYVVTGGPGLSGLTSPNRLPVSMKRLSSMIFPRGKWFLKKGLSFL
jgi:hypothetical protein